MARIRSIHPGLASDECYMSMSMPAKAAWPMLWTECDDHGVFEWKPIVLKARIFPADNVDFAGLLAEFMELGCVMKADVDGKPYGFIRNFCKYQRPKSPSYRHPFPECAHLFVGHSGNAAEALPQDYPSPTEIATQMKGEGGKGKETTTVSNEPVVVRAKARPEHVQILEILTSVIPEAQAKAVMDHRRKKKSPLNSHSAGLLVKQFQQLEEPTKGADLMMMRGWQGCDPEWCANAGLKLASSPSPSAGAAPARAFVKRDSEAWWAWRDHRKAEGRAMPTAVSSKEHVADGWWFDTEYPPGYVPTESVEAYAERERNAA